MELDCESVAAVAAEIRFGLSGSRLHGALVGGLCAGAGQSGAWAELLESALQLDDAPIGAFMPELRELLVLSDAALRDPEFGFEPMLPEWEERLAGRVQALAEWCHAFVIAYAAAAREPDGAAVSAESGELLSDLTAIAGGLDPEAMAGGDEDEDEDEGDYVQIVEFVRVAVLSLFSERRSDGDATLH